MADITMPQLGETVTEGTITKWFKAVGDTVLLQERATKAALVEALAGRPRWRWVHLACHGMLDSGRPLLSSLALTADETDDGLLTVLDVVRMRISADLVVLSACETGKGKVHRAEGVVGFVRAFMMAGAPRVIVSLWEVDDDATGECRVPWPESACPPWLICFLVENQ